MKKLIFAALAAISISATAQNYDYRPRETWPYLLEEFTSGVVTNFGGERQAEGYFNVCVTDGSLHYIKDGKIMAADMRHFQAARIGNDAYVNRMGRIKKVVAEEPGGKFLLLDVSVDMDELAKQDIGLGVKSSLASTQKLNNIGISGGTTVNMELNTLISGAKDGPELPLKYKYTFLLGSRETDATKAAFQSLPGIDKAQSKAFLKEEKIKWHKEESLIKVLKYIAAHSE